MFDIKTKNNFPSKPKQHKGFVCKQTSLLFLYHFSAAATEALYSLADKQPLSSSPHQTSRLEMQEASTRRHAAEQSQIQYLFFCQSFFPQNGIWEKGHEKEVEFQPRCCWRGNPTAEVNF